MVTVLEHHWRPDGSLGRVQSESELIGLSDIVSFLRRSYLSIAGCVAATLLGAGFYLATTDPVFTASTQILIEPKIPQFPQNQPAEVIPSLDTAQVESQIAVMNSEKIAALVINNLKLLDDPEFNRPLSPTLTERFRKLGTAIAATVGFKQLRNVGSPPGAVPDLTEFERSRRTMRILFRGMDIRRIGLSYAVEISYRSRDPDMAAKVANGVAEAFIREQIDANANTARQGGAWLEERITELRMQMNTATQIAQEFRARHDFGVGHSTASGETSHEEAGQPGRGGPTIEELEVTADSYRKMYESFLQAFTNSISQQSYPVANARVITTATRPLVASHPLKTPVLAFGLLAGLVSGVGLALLRNMFDRSIRSSQQLREAFGLRCLGELPASANKNSVDLLDEVARFPQSGFSESLKRASSSIALDDAEGPMKCLGITSALPSDGKSLIASNLATISAMKGKRTLVIDADSEHLLLTREIGGNNDRLFDFLQANGPSPVSTGDMEALLRNQHGYDTILVDLPPLASGADRLAPVSLLDSVILVAKAGKTPLDMFAELVRTLEDNKSSIAGVLLTNVQTASARRYGRSQFKSDPHPISGR